MAKEFMGSARAPASPVFPARADRDQVFPGPALVQSVSMRRLKAGRPLSGKVWRKVDADFSPVAVGDMLTTSSTPGHAMRANDPARAFGAGYRAEQRHKSGL